MRVVTAKEFYTLPDGTRYKDAYGVDCTKHNESHVFSDDTVSVYERADLHKLLATIHTALAVAE